MPRTFGFEAEWQANAVDLAAELYARRLVVDDTIHRYHCGCGGCDFRSGFLFRVQSDSSCNGEVISHVFSSVESGRDAMDQLQEAALAIDAEPGYEAGFHVHVNANQMNSQQRRLALWTFMLYEPLLQRIASGRFPSQRIANHTLESLHRAFWYRAHQHAVFENAPWYDRAMDPHVGGYPVRVPPSGVRPWVQDLSRSTRMTLLGTLLDYHHASDRHSNLNVRTRHDTWEFRLWNSTRSAWRMELFARLSLAFTTPDIVSQLDRQWVEDEEEQTNVLLAVCDNPLRELLQRQLTFINDGRGTDEPFTALPAAA